MPSPCDERSPKSLDLTALSRDLLRGHRDHRDIAQEAWILYQRRPVEGLRSPRAWMKAAILHLASRLRRRDRSRRRRERIAARPELLPSVEEELERSNQEELLRSLVWKLPEPYRVPTGTVGSLPISGVSEIWLHYAQGPDGPPNISVTFDVT